LRPQLRGARYLSLRGPGGRMQAVADGAKESVLELKPAEDGGAGANHQQCTGAIDEDFSLFPLQEDERDTARALTSAPERVVRVAPTHSFTHRGEFSGFRLTVPKDDIAGALPVNRSMFHGVSMVEVDGLLEGGPAGANGWAQGATGGLHPAAMHLLLESSGSENKLQATMRAFMARVRQAAAGNTASLQCMPVFSGSDSGSAAERMRDGADWAADCPATIGLYHGFVKRTGRLTREHRLYLVCAGGMRQACDDFMNLALDISQTSATAGDLCGSEEVWWLRKACSRMRADLLAQCAQAFNLSVRTYRDAHSFRAERQLAQVTTETLHHDLQTLRDSSVGVFNRCVDPSTPRNGVLMSVAPSEGLLLFRGADRSSAAARDYGDVFGTQRLCGVFPVSTEVRAPTARDKRETTRLVLQDRLDPSCVVCESGEAGSAQAPATSAAHHLRLDEAFMRHLEAKMQWKRDYGVVELMPIMVGVFDS